MKTLFDSNNGPSPVEYSVLVTILVVICLAGISYVQKSAPPYLTQIPVTTVR
ncbi:MAG: hypothetical protein MUC43_02620 [Pirellula sp.]|nr:hypothetical protein [Pirellula sp.]